jgi:hypothetical protein
MTIICILVMKIKLYFRTPTPHLGKLSRGGVGWKHTQKKTHPLLRTRMIRQTNWFSSHCRFTRSMNVTWLCFWNIFRLYLAEWRGVSERHLLRYEWKTFAETFVVIAPTPHTIFWLCTKAEQLFHPDLNFCIVTYFCPLPSIYVIFFRLSNCMSTEISCI